MVTIRHIRPDDASEWLRLRWALWPEGAEDEHRDEIEQFFAGTFPRSPWAVLVADDDAGRVLGFVELSTRPYAEGCTTSRVAYVEGWFVMPEARRRGIGRALLAATEAWARAQGCTELASDADPDNHVSHAAHNAFGFEDVGLVRCFRKELD